MMSVNCLKFTFKIQILIFVLGFAAVYCIISSNLYGNSYATSTVIQVRNSVVSAPDSNHNFVRVIGINDVSWEQGIKKNVAIRKTQQPLEHNHLTTRTTLPILRESENHDSKSMVKTIRVAARNVSVSIHVPDTERASTS